MEKFSRTVELLKIDEEERNVWGIFSVSTIGDELLKDSQDDIIRPKELEKAAHKYLMGVNKGSTMGNSHNQMQVGELIESFVFTKEKTEFLEESLKKMGAKDVSIKPGAEFWVGGFHVTDDKTWDMVKSGEFTSFSIGGKALKVEIEI